MSNKLVVGKNYGHIFGVKPPDRFVYNGGISWTYTIKGQKVTKDSQRHTDEAVTYLQQGVYRS